MDMDAEAEALLARIRMVREDFDRGRLNPHQVRLYRVLGAKVDQITRAMDVAQDVETAEALWTAGAALIRAFLEEHFPPATRH